MVAAAAAFIVQTAAGRAIRILSAEQTEGFKIIAEDTAHRFCKAVERIIAVDRNAMTIPYGYAAVHHKRIERFTFCRVYNGRERIVQRHLKRRWAQQHYICRRVFF